MCAVCWVFCLFWFFVCFCKSTHLHLPQLRKSPSFCSFLKISLNGSWRRKERILLRIEICCWDNHALIHANWDSSYQHSTDEITLYFHSGSAVRARVKSAASASGCSFSPSVMMLMEILCRSASCNSYNWCYVEWIRTGGLQRVPEPGTCLTSLGLHCAATAALFVQSLNIWSVSVIVEVGQALPSSASYRIRSLRWPRHGLKLFLIHTPCVGAGVSLGLVETLRSGGDLREGLGF